MPNITAAAFVRMPFIKGFMALSAAIGKDRNPSCTLVEYPQGAFAQVLSHI
jgi:hypothetical protein